MVHALCDVCRVLVPGGIVLDLRPRSAAFPLHLVTPETDIQVGIVDVSGKIPQDVMADDAIAHAIEQRWLEFAGKREFDIEIGFDTTADLAAYASARTKMVLTPPYEELDHLLNAESFGSPARLRYRLPMMLASYRTFGHVNERVHLR